MHSFDIVCKIDLQELDNAIQQARREIQTRYDFKGSKTTIEFHEKEHTVVLTTETDFRAKSVLDILQSKMVKRGISLKAITLGKIEPAAGGMVRQTITLQQGIPVEKAREIVKLIKNSKRKVQAAIQAEQVRVSGKSIDELQAIIQMLKAEEMGIHMQFVNMREN